MTNTDAATRLAGRLAHLMDEIGDDERALLGAILAAARQSTDVAGYGDGDREPGLFGRDDIAGTLNSPLLAPGYGVGWQQLEATKIDQAADHHRR